jgi:hypothetical protein
MGHRSASYGRADADTVGRIGPSGKPGGCPRSHGAWGATLLIAVIQAIDAVPLRRNARIPGEWALPAGSGDVLTALFALPAAIAWNTSGLADFAVAITLGFITSPRSAPVDRSGCAEHRRRRLSGCADPGFRGAKLDPAARAVVAPADPTIRRLMSFLSFDLDADNSRRMEGWSNAR